MRASTRTGPFVRAPPRRCTAPGKSTDQVVQILGRLAESHVNVLATRATPRCTRRRSRLASGSRGIRRPGLLVANPEVGEGVGLIVVVSAGTADLAVAEEAAVTAEVRGQPRQARVRRRRRRPHRLLAQHPLVIEANAIVVVAGMEGALASVVGGLVRPARDRGADQRGLWRSEGGFAALLTMLATCVPGIAVVNIDNGFGAACLADRINKLAAKIR